jgi:hypothetical protein
MAKTHGSYVFLYAASGLLLGLGVSCSSQSAQKEAQATGGELAELEASLNATSSSLASTDQAVQECFTAFRSCNEAAAGDADARGACRDELGACLPDAPVSAPECAADAGAPGGGFAGRGGPGRGFGFGFGQERGRFGGGQADTDAGAGAGVRDDRGPGAQCLPPGFPQGGLRGCSGRAHDNIMGGGAPGAVASSCRACVRELFAERAAALCAKAEALCAADGAPQRLCERVSEKCADVGGGAADAGSP